MSMMKPKPLSAGDKVAIVSLSSGMLGENFCRHTLLLGEKRLKEFGLEPVFMPYSLKGIDYLKEHPEKRAMDLKTAFMDDSIKGIICAIGGDDTYRILPYLMEDKEFIKKVRTSPKLFTGFWDTTINHLMFYKLEMTSYYGPNFICDLGEMEAEMLPYTKQAFKGYLKGNEQREIISSECWYEERTDFSEAAIGSKHISHKEEKGYEVLQGEENFQGKLIGGCIESIYDILSGERYDDEQEICERYSLFPSVEEWKNSILFLETCEEKPLPKQLKKELLKLKEKGVFNVISGLIIGKPQDETFYEEYKEIYLKTINNRKLPILYNLNFGHALPRCVLPYGVQAKVDLKGKRLIFLESMFSPKI